MDTDTTTRCQACGSIVGKHIVAISVQRERVVRVSEFSSVLIEDSWQLAVFCSQLWCARMRDSVLQFQGAQIHEVGLSPIEPCALCHRGVAMCAWHTAYVEEDLVQECVGVQQPIAYRYLAVLCQRRSPKTTISETSYC